MGIILLLDAASSRVRSSLHLMVFAGHDCYSEAGVLSPWTPVQMPDNAEVH
jgi:hypothetical protein